jgi:hypothetical protein
MRLSIFLSAVLLLLLLLLSLSGCGATGYYSRGANPLAGAGGVTCVLPATKKFAASYAITNNVQACRDLGGSPLRPAMAR